MQIAERLARDPSQFAAVAGELSEDVATQPVGGMIGVRPATDYIRTPEILDAVAALRPGEVSDVVETQYGFHILQKLPLPEAQTLRGARILIAHDKAPWLGMFLARETPPSRSPEEARLLAGSLYTRALEGEPFADLAREYSEHREALRGGDFGSWSTREPTPFSREMEVLSTLEVDQLSPPLDSPFGIVILQRLPDVPRVSFGMTTVQQPFDPRAPASSPTSREWVLKNMRALAREVGKDEHRFAELQKEFCCESEEHWLEGRGEAEAEALLRKLAPGETSAEPVQLARAYAIIKRIEPRLAASIEYSSDLPAPKKVDLRQVVAAGTMRTTLSTFKAECAAALGLEGPLAQKLTELIAGLLANQDGDEQARLASFERMQADVQTLLGGETFQRYLELLTAYTEASLLQPDASPRARLLGGMPVR